MQAQEDYWRVNSYGYPNPFSSEQNAQQAWDTFLSFFEYSSYSHLKDYWASKAPRTLNSHAVESWKAAFEEFGLLYVLSRSDQISITPAGHQFRTAGEKGQASEFEWIGLSLLLRYPLHGPRRSKGPRHGTSDLLLYWFLFAALCDLDNYIWWTELERILCQVFTVDEAKQAIEDVKQLRAKGKAPLDFYLPEANNRGGFYNSLNQVIVHAGMNHLLLDNGTLESPYWENKTERKTWIKSDKLPLIQMALGGGPDLDCGEPSTFVERMPKAPMFGSEEDYFTYLGAAVQPLPTISTPSQLRSVVMDNESIRLLKHKIDYTARESEIVGQVATLCRLVIDQRVILSHDLKWLYVVTGKARDTSGEIRVSVRRGRPITNAEPIKVVLEGLDG